MEDNLFTSPNIPFSGISLKISIFLGGDGENKKLLMDWIQKAFLWIGIVIIVLMGYPHIDADSNQPEDGRTVYRPIMGVRGSDFYLARRTLSRQGGGQTAHLTPPPNQY